MQDTHKIAGIIEAARDRIEQLAVWLDCGAVSERQAEHIAEQLTEISASLMVARRAITGTSDKTVRRLRQDLTDTGAHGPLQTRAGEAPNNSERR